MTGRGIPGFNPDYVENPPDWLIRRQLNYEIRMLLRQCSETNREGRPCSRPTLYFVPESGVCWAHASPAQRGAQKRFSRERAERLKAAEIPWPIECEEG